MYVASADSHHRQVDVGRVQLQVDLPVNGGLAVLVEILSHLGRHCSENTHTRTKTSDSELVILRKSRRQLLWLAWTATTN